LPLYEYHCPQCGHRYEKIQKFNAEPDTACPKCGSELRRPLTAPALQFKGAGWYVNDYASKGNANKAEKPAGEAGSASTEAKPSTESKPAAAESATKPAASSSGAGSTNSAT
jgi:putative FmdB family regulatory protein